MARTSATMALLPVSCRLVTATLAVDGLLAKSRAQDAPMTSPPPIHNACRIRTARSKAIGLMALATICFAGLDSTAKYLVGIKGVPVPRSPGSASPGTSVFTALVLWPLAFKPSLRSKKPLVQIVRSALMVGTTGFNFVALRYLQLDQTVTIFFLTPLLVAALAGPLLGEWVGWHRMLAIVAGFLGVLLVMHPGFGTVHWAMLLVLVATFGYALYNLATRYLAAFDPPEVTQTFTPLVGAVVLVPFALVGLGARRTTRYGVAAACLARLLGRARALAADPGAPHRAGFGARAVHLSRADLDVGRGYLVFEQGADVVDAVSGAAIVILSGLYLFARERKVIGTKASRPRLRHRHAVTAGSARNSWISHGRAWPGHPRFISSSNTWMPGPRPGMTT